MLIYFYSKDTKEYLYQIAAQKDLNASIRLGYDVWVKPPFSTYKKPLEVEENEVTIFNEEKDEWEIKSDFRGKKAYNEKTGDSIIIEEVGELPKNYTLKKPFILQQAKIEKNKEVSVKYKEELERSIDLGKVEEPINNIIKIEKFIDLVGDKPYINYEKEEGTFILLTKEELEEYKDNLYKRNILLTLKQKDILDKVKNSKNEKQLKEIKISFNIEKEFKKVRNYTEEEFEKYIKERI